MGKKILFIVTQSEFGGAQHFLAHLTAALDREKYDIIVGAGLEGDDETGLLSFLEKKGINTKHLKYLRRGVNPLFDFLGLIEIRKLVKKEKPDVLFLCSSKAGAIGSLATTLYPKSYTLNPKVIYRIGGWTFNDPWSWWKKLFYKIIEKISARWKDIIIVNADCHRKQAIELGIKPRQKIVTVYNGINTNNLVFFDKEKARKQLKRKMARLSLGDERLSHAIFLIGTIANLYPSKGLEHLIGAAKVLEDKSIKFIVIGEGIERKKLERLIKKYKLENSFFLIGAIDDVYKYLKAFDAFVLPSVKEGFPWTILEAMAAEIPIVATKVGAVPEVIEDKKTGLLVEPGDFKELAKAITELINNKPSRDKLTSQARKLVQEKFTLDKMVKEVEKLL